MIQFIRHTYGASKPAIIGPCRIKPGEPILKILFDRKDVHKSRTGVLHLDVWGGKLQNLKRLLGVSK